MLIDGHDLRDVTEHSLRSQLGIVPQESFLFSGTIGDNIALRAARTRPTTRCGRRRRPWARTSSSSGCRTGYDTEVGERGGHLSAGQRQLVAFARAAAADPRILILDEATSNVDVRTESQIEHGLRRLLAGRTAIVIAHRLSTIRGAGRIVVLDHGRIAEAGHARGAARRERRVRAPVPRLGCAVRRLSARYSARREEACLSGPRARRPLALLPATASAAVTMTDFKVEPASKQGGGHPNVTITQTFSYGSSSTTA